MYSGALLNVVVNGFCIISPLFNHIRFIPFYTFSITLYFFILFSNPIYCIPKPTKPATCSFYGCMAKKICLEMYLTPQSIFYQQHIFIILHLRKLRHIQLIISSLLLQKLCRTSLLPNATLIYHKDTVCILNR